MTYSFRKATGVDVDSLRQFSCADRGLAYTREVEQLIRGDVADEIASGSTEAHVDIAIDDTATIVGVITYGTTPLDGADDLEDALFIYALGVHPEHRRRLIGTLLKQRVFAAATTMQLRLVVSQVHRRNVPMQQLNKTLDVVSAPDPTDGEYLISVARVDDDNPSL